MASIFGTTIKVSIFGQSHAPAIGVTIDGLPVGEVVDEAQLRVFLARRAPGGAAWSTQRKEPDMPEILCGVASGRTCGAPLTVIIRNTDVRPGDYSAFSDTPRPAHADYTGRVRYGGWNDPSGGGHFSGRLTAALCAAGGICMQILSRRGIEIGAHLAQVGSVRDAALDPAAVTPDMLCRMREAAFPALDAQAGAQMQAEIEAARAAGDSVGGVIECAAAGVPAGYGSPIFDGAENRIAQAVFAIPGVKGLEFGSGFAGSTRRGSENNDPFTLSGGAVCTVTNNHGGLLGGITTGMPVVFRAAMKPTPSIFQPQQSVDLRAMTETQLQIKGRHDPCIAVRAVPCMEAAMAVALIDLITDGAYAKWN